VRVEGGHVLHSLGLFEAAAFPGPGPPYGNGRAAAEAGHGTEHAMGPQPVGTCERLCATMLLGFGLSLIPIQGGGMRGQKPEFATQATHKIPFGGGRNWGKLGVDSRGAQGGSRLL
jgi:hypothetical protein